MDGPLQSLDSMYPPWKTIADKYESLFDDLKVRRGDAADYSQKEEALFWENQGFELMVTLLVRKRIPFEAGVQDVQPIIEDERGVPKEVDFRMRIRNIPTLFGVTHFHDGPKDLQKDVEGRSTPIHEIRKNGNFVASHGTIVGSRPQDEYLNRRIAVRIAREGKTKLPYDYIYMLFPQCAPGFGGGLDCIPLGFQFDRESKYEYKPVGITGLVLIGQHIKATSTGMNISDDELLIRTLPFPSCSPVARQLLQALDHCVVSNRKRNEQAQEVIARCSACRQLRTCPYNDLGDCVQMRDIVGE